MAEAKWYVVHTYSGYENKVKANIDKTIENRHLEDEILEVRVPMQEVVELKNGVQKASQKKMFPGYVLINMIMNDDTWYVVRNTRGVTGFVGPGSKPVPLTDEEMVPLGIQKEDIVVDFEEGDILINGKSIKKSPIECKKQMAYVPDNPDLYENMKAIDFINFICDMYEVSKEVREENIDKYAKMFEMQEKLDNYISSFSHGMKQKIALIAALVHNPDVLIMDEPFVGLDPKAVFDIKEVMKDMCKQGKTIFFSTHILEVAEKLCDRVAIIKQGKIVKIGNMKEIKGDESLEQVFLELDEGEKI